MCFIRDCFEDELVPVFASVGRIYELRLMIEFSGTNRNLLLCQVPCHILHRLIADFTWQKPSKSKCFKSLLLIIRYCNENDAKEAVRKLHRYRIRLLIHFHPNDGLSEFNFETGPTSC